MSRSLVLRCASLTAALLAAAIPVLGGTASAEPSPIHDPQRQAALELRKEAHATTSAFTSHLVAHSALSPDQQTYVLASILKPGEESADTTAEEEEGYREDFWDIIEDKTGMPRSTVLEELRKGRTLKALGGSSSQQLEVALYRYLARPIAQAQAEGVISSAHSEALRGKVKTAVKRMVRQQGGGDRPVNLVP